MSFLWTNVELVHELREELLASAALPLDQHGPVRERADFDQVAYHAPPERTLADHVRLHGGRAHERGDLMHAIDSRQDIFGT